MKLFLIRHGVAETGGRLAGHADYPLAEEGKRQAAMLAQHLQDQSLTRVFTSPLKRAYSTATAIASATGLVPDVWPELMERSGGVFNGRTIEEAQNHFPDLFAHAWSNPLVAPPFGESYEDVSVRVQVVIDRLLQLPDDEVVAVIAHNGCLNVLLHTMLRLDTSLFPLFKIEPTGVTLLSIAADRQVTVRYVNRLEHLTK